MFVIFISSFEIGTIVFELEMQNFDLNMSIKFLFGAYNFVLSYHITKRMLNQLNENKSWFSIVVKSNRL